MDLVIAIPVFILTAMLQVAGISRLPLIHGTADLSLLVLIAWGIHSRSSLAWVWAIIAGIVNVFYSQVNWLAIILPYTVILVITRLFHGRFWNSPILVMLLMTIIGSILVQATTLLVLFFQEIPFNLNQAFSEIMLPSIFLNLILALPVYFLVKDLSFRLYPQVENE